jgi:hypothetical protein
MAFYLIGYRCGHDVREQIYGTDVRGEREAEAARRAAQLCPACWRADRDATAAAAAQALGLPELTGSENQVRWATTIRHDALCALERQMSKPTAALADIQARTVAYRAVLASVTSARAWIDHRAVRSPVPDLIVEFLDDTGRARLSDIAAKELAPVLAAAGTDPGAPPEPELADTTSAAHIQPAEPGAGPVLELPMLVSRAHRVWRAVRTGLAEPWRIPTLHPTLIPALTETSLTGYLLRTAVHDAATAPSEVTSSEIYRSARLLLNTYRNHTRHDHHTPDHDGTCENSTTEDAHAPADWWVKARVRVTTAARCGHRVFTPGQELDLLAFGFAGHPRREDSWWDTDPATALDIHNELDDVAVIEDDNVEVISILGRSDS